MFQITIYFLYVAAAGLLPAGWFPTYPLGRFPGVNGHDGCLRDWLRQVAHELATDLERLERRAPGLPHAPVQPLDAGKHCSRGDRVQTQDAGGGVVALGNLCTLHELVEVAKRGIDLLPPTRFDGSREPAARLES